MYNNRTDHKKENVTLTFRNNGQGRNITILKLLYLVLRRTNRGQGHTVIEKVYACISILGKIRAMLHNRCRDGIPVSARVSKAKHCYYEIYYLQSKLWLETLCLNQ